VNCVFLNAFILTEETVKAVPTDVAEGIIIELVFWHFKAIVFATEI